MLAPYPMRAQMHRPVFLFLVQCLVCFVLFHSICRHLYRQVSISTVAAHCIIMYIAGTMGHCIYPPWPHGNIRLGQFNSGYPQRCVPLAYMPGA